MTTISDDAGPIRRTGAAESLLLAAALRDEELRACVADVGFENASRLVLGELAARCDPPGLPYEIPIGLRLVGDGDAADFTVTVGPNGLETTAPAGITPPVSVTIGLRELLRQLYGTAGGGRPAPPRVQVGWPADKDIPALIQEMGPVLLALDTLLAACAGGDADLGRLSMRFGSDKWGGVHWYTRHYEEHFRRLRGEPVRLLEIGVGGYSDTGSGGASLRMWERYFRRGLIYGLDLHPKPGTLGPRITTLRGDQSDPRRLADIAAQYGPFDIVIDDGSHVNEHVKTSFDALFPYVRNGGMYVIEDVQTSYWPGYGGHTDPDAPGTTLALMKQLVNLMQRREYGAGESNSFAAEHTVGVHFYHNIVFVDKNLNDEEPVPAWIPRVPFD